MDHFRRSKKKSKKRKSVDSDRDGGKREEKKLTSLSFER